MIKKFLPKLPPIAAVKIDWRIAITAMVCIAGLEGYAMYQGHDGWLCGIAIAAVAGIAGFTVNLRR